MPVRPSKEDVREDVRHAALSADELQLSYGSNVVLNGLSLGVAPGEFLAIVGPSGGGKSTLLRCLTLLDVPSSGRIWLQNSLAAEGHTLHIPPETLRRRVGLVFQEFNLWPNRSAQANVTEGLRSVLRMGKGEANDRGRHWLERCGVAEKASSYPYALSGGQKQRVALARALAMEPEVLLLDEITSQLDVLSTAQILELLEGLRDGRQSIVFVTHHLHFARRNTDRVAVLMQGRIVEVGPSEEVIANPKEEHSRRFLARIQEIW